MCAWLNSNITKDFPTACQNLSCVLVCLYACMFASVLFLLLWPNERPHSGQGSSQITEQNCRQPAAWVVNKCHHNIDSDRRGGEHRGKQHWREGKTKCRCCYLNRKRDTVGMNGKRQCKKGEWVNEIFDLNIQREGEDEGKGKQWNATWNLSQKRCQQGRVQTWWD